MWAKRKRHSCTILKMVLVLLVVVLLLLLSWCRFSTSWYTEMLLVPHCEFRIYFSLENPRNFVSTNKLYIHGKWFLMNWILQIFEFFAMEKTREREREQAIVWQDHTCNSGSKRHFTFELADWMAAALFSSIFVFCFCYDLLLQNSIALASVDGVSICGKIESIIRISCVGSMKSIHTMYETCTLVDFSAYARHSHTHPCTQFCKRAHSYIYCKKNS